MSDAKSQTIAERLRLCRKEAHETLDQLARLVDVNKSTVLRWERGETAKINRPTLQRLAEHFDVDIDWLAGEAVPRRREGSEPPAVRILSFEDLPGLLQVPGRSRRLRQTPPLAATPWENALALDESGFWLRVVGDSMSPLINEGDIVHVHRQPTVEDGQFAVLLLDGAEGVIRRVHSGVNWIELCCLNPQYPPRIFTDHDLLRVCVLGLVTECRRCFV